MNIARRIHIALDFDEICKDWSFFRGWGLTIQQSKPWYKILYVNDETNRKMIQTLAQKHSPR